MEVRQLASARPVTVHNGNAGQGGNMTSLIVPAATLGALGYGYMWWRGLSFSDLMYVTKRSMDKAVSSLKENLEIVSASLDALKSYFTQRIKNLDEKLDEQKEMSTEIIKEVIDAQNKVTNIGYDLNSLQQLVCGLDLKMSIIEDKQNKEYNGVRYLCNYVAENSRKSADLRQIEQMITGAREIKDEQKATGTRETKGLQHIVEAIESNFFDKSKTEAILQDDPDSNRLKCQSVLGLPFYYSKLLDPAT